MKSKDILRFEKESKIVKKKTGKFVKSVKKVYELERKKNNGFPPIEIEKLLILAVETNTRAEAAMFEARLLAEETEYWTL